MPILNWLTREEDIRTASSVPYQMLIEGPTVSTGDPDAENALIHSDNLVPVPDSLVDTGKSLPTVDSSLRGNDGQVKRVSGIRHIQVETVLAYGSAPRSWVLVGNPLVFFGLDTSANPPARPSIQWIPGYRTRPLEDS